MWPASHRLAASVVLAVSTRAFVVVAPVARRPGTSKRRCVEARRWVSSTGSDSESAEAGSRGEAPAKKRVVFLGSPGVAARTLEGLVAASSGREFEVVACVSQPPAAKGRKKVVQACEAQTAAESLGVPCLTPAKAKDPEFLASLARLEPDLCVTAAYGQFLPRAFLEIPKYGTWNIHPSLLPLYRGAAPLQRALERGDAVVGVTVLETVLRMDAGPIVAQVERVVRPDDAAPALLDELFATGVDLLVENLPDLWAGTVQYTAQDEALATHAPKLEASEAELDVLAADDDDPRSLAARAADKVRAFAPWPGTWLQVKLHGHDQPTRLKVLEAAAVDPPPDRPLDPVVALVGDALRLRCADGSALDLITVQPPNRKPMPAKAFWNGLRGAPLDLVAATSRS